MRTTLQIMVLWAVVYACSVAQWVDQFDHTLDTAWFGDRSHFVVDPLARLRLQSPAAGSSALWRRYAMMDSVVLSCSAFLEFSPSATNRLVIYLASAEPRTDASAHLRLEIGENGNLDTWKLYCFASGKDTLLASGEPGAMATGPLAIRFELKRLPPDNWTLYAGTVARDTSFSGISFTTTWPGGEEAVYFGIRCIYTETRKSAFAFDDISASVDRTPPSISSHQISGNETIAFRFDERLDSASCNKTMRFKLDDREVPVSAQWSSETVLRLTFGSAFVSGKRYTLDYEGIADLSGNVSQPQRYAFRTGNGRTPQPAELVISEVMPDPSPPFVLPEVEYVEIHNRTPDFLNLSGCRFSDGSSWVVLPDSILPPGAYAILCPGTAVEAFRAFGLTVGVDAFPALNNTGDVLELRDPGDRYLFQCRYSLADYGDVVVAEGGYALEWISLEAPCIAKGGFVPSRDPKRGTPGTANSWISLERDTSGPQLTQVYALSEWEVSLRFDELLHPDLVMHPGDFRVEPGIGVAAVDFGDARNELHLVLHQPLEPSRWYVAVCDRVADCSGRVAHLTSGSFAKPKVPVPGDLVWSEVLFNPWSYHFDFVEIHNRSGSPIALRGLVLSNPLTGEASYPMHGQRVIAPGGYFALTSDPEDLASVYPACDPINTAAETIPPIDDDGGVLVLAYADGQRILTLDSFVCSAEWHHPWAGDPEGKSLEKINPSLPSAFPGSWQTALAGIGFATPGKPNSQFVSLLDAGKGKPYAIQSRRVSPNGDGFEDSWILTFGSIETGWHASIDLYDLSGNAVCRVYSGLVAPLQWIIWHGQGPQGLPLTPGNYIAIITLKHPSGKRSEYKEAVALLRE
ncbi:MAG: lamin tail domain-containing protein [Saprospiraceae bacterium]|nr:lamin tail domain-containing protein [Saprospiraceae bacterium]